MADNDKDIPVAKFMWQFIVVIFLAGGGWQMLASVAADVEENTEKIEEQEKRDDEVDKKLERITVTQEFIKEEIKDQGDKLDEILDALRETD